LFETLLSGFEREVDHVARYFDAHATPVSFVSWLASWLGIAADENWPAEKVRMLIDAAPELYKKRGTRYGMEAIIEIFTAERPIILEHFHIGCEQDPEMNQQYVELFGEDAHRFWVILKPFQVHSEEERAAVRRIVEAEKPAHTCAELLQLQPRIRLGILTYLGENTYLVGEARLDEGAALSTGSVLL
jgi:phage tail-like protein